MTVKAICTVGAVGRYASDHTEFYIGINYAALDDSDPAIQGVTYLYGLDPAADGTLLTTSIEAQMKTYLAAQGVSFGLLDTVRLLPALV
jgi:hypothetical protein